MTKHTPMPWKIGDRSPYVEIWGPMRMNHHPILASMEHEPREENAALIIKAVNNHDALVEALHEARMALFKIRACSIAGCEEGYGKPEKWADALFASHGDVAASLKTIDRVLGAVSSQKEPS